MADNARGGNDTLTGGGFHVTNFLYGDAYTMSDNAQGGDDTLIGGSTAQPITSTATPMPCPTTPAAATTR